MSVDEPYVDTSDHIEIEDNYSSATIYKVNTPKGERLGIESPGLGTSIQLDALDLESVSWQDAETLRDIARQTHPDLSIEDVVPSQDKARTKDRGASIKVGNEFTQVTMTVIHSSQGECIELRSEKLDYKTQLSAAALEALTTSSPEIFDQFLGTPFGPDQQH